MRLTLSTLALLALTAAPLSAQTAPADGAAPADSAQPADAATAGAATDAAPATDAAAAPAGDAAAAGSLPGSEEAVPEAGTYALDPEHSHIVWTYEHMGFSTSTGLIRGVTGTITLDPADPGAATVQASFPLSALKTVSATLDQHMMGEDFFAGATPDTAVTFNSTAVEVTGDRTANVTGDLTLNGVTKPVTLEVRMRGVGQDPVTGDFATGFQAAGTLLRSDFNLGAFAPAVSDEVKVEINVEAHKT